LKSTGTHLRTGISIEAVWSREGVMLYAGKLCMGKEIAGFEGDSSLLAINFHSFSSIVPAISLKDPDLGQIIFTNMY